MNNKNKFYILVFLFIILSLLVIKWHSLLNNEAEVVFMDVGQGDAILVQKGDFQVLIDGGPSSLVVEKLGQYMPFWDRKIEMVILSHPHADHFLGLIDVFDRFQVEKFMWSAPQEEAADFEVFLEKVAQENVEEIIADAHQDFVFEKIRFDILYPLFAESFLDKDVKNLNNTSVVLRVFTESKSTLLTGDAEVEVEEDLLQANVLLDSDILKAGHHGSKTSSSSSFLKAVSPQEVIFCAGEDNKFKHPAAEIIDRYKELGVETKTLFETGDIVYKI